MSDLGKAYVQIVPKADGISNKIKSTLSPGMGAVGESAGSSFVSKFAKIAGGAALGATVVKGLKMALDEGGKLQQSYGGLDTLYGDAAQAAKDYAVQAAQAGISANDYAEQAVSFGAGLKAAFGGDTAKAAEAANTAILDMADNAAKMGTPLESIQNAYQGFAKGNYTMLDNLKLGYGGTKSEMERLLSDATKLTGVKYDMNNLGDVYSAIHAIQGDLGLTGVAAEEASSTFSGSFGAMKASAKNFLAALTTGGDIQSSMTTMLESVGTFLFGNLVPMLGNVVQAIPGAVVSAVQFGAQTLMTEGPGLINGLITGIQTGLPVLVAKGQEILGSIRDGIVTYMPILWDNAVTIITGYATKITELMPLIITKGGELIATLANAIVTYLPNLANSAVETINSIGNFLADNLPTLGARIGEFTQTMGATIIRNVPIIIRAIGRAAPTVLAAIGQIGITIIQNVTKLLPKLANLGFQAISGLARGMGGAALGLVKSAMENIKNAMTEPIQKAKDTVSKVIDTIKGFFPISVGKILDNIKLPHFSVDGGEFPYGVGGKGYMPSFGVDWYARGGIINQAQIIGVGEAGPEAVVPLSGNHMKPFTDAIAAAEAKNNNALINGMYRAFSAALDNADLTVQIGNREFGRILREAGAL